MKQIVITLVLVLAFTTSNAQSDVDILRSGYLNSIGKLSKNKSDFTHFTYSLDVLVQVIQFDDLRSRKERKNPDMYPVSQYVVEMMAEAAYEVIMSDKNILDDMLLLKFTHFKLVYLDNDYYSVHSKIFKL